MTIRRIAIYTAIALTLLTIGVRHASADGVGVPVISAPFVTVSVGSTFTIPISIADATDLTSWQFDLAFNPAIVKANSVTEGPFMLAFGTTLSPPTFFSPGVIDNTTGLISLVADSFIDLPPLPSGAGILANIEFTALKPGVSPLTFSNVFLNDLDQGFDIKNGQITVVPEPTTLALLIGGLALLGARRLAGRRRRDGF
jgi:general secretion pathway protein D